MRVIRISECNWKKINKLRGINESMGECLERICKEVIDGEEELEIEDKEMGKSTTIAISDELWYKVQMLRIKYKSRSINNIIDAIMRCR